MPLLPLSVGSNVFDMIEVWNGPMSERNVKAILWWTEMLKTGRRIPICGGSDFHRPHGAVKLGHPVTGVYAESRGALDILSALNAGHSFVTRNTRGARLLLSYGEAYMGDVTSLREGTALRIEASGLRSEDVFLVTDRGERAVARNARGDLHAETSAENIIFAYLLIKKRGRVTALTNPVYFR